MNKLKKCQKCKAYTLKDIHCNEKTIEAGYKYIKITKPFEFTTP